MFRSSVRIVVLSILLLAAQTMFMSRAHARNDTPQVKCSELLKKSPYVEDSNELDVHWVDQQIKEIKTAPTPEQQVLRQAAQLNGLPPLTLNREIIENHNANYTNVIAIPQVTNQYQSGRCWIFASLNMLRSKLFAEKLVGKDFEFSENYLYFFSLLEKANTTLMVAQQAIKSVGPDRGKLLDAIGVGTSWISGDGGTHQWFNYLVKKYGMVPKSAMQEASGSVNSSVLSEDLQKKLMVATELMRQVVWASDMSPVEINRTLRAIREATLKDVMTILVTNLGTPPAEFTFRMQKPKGKMKKNSPLEVRPSKLQEFTPQSFARDFVKYDPDEYVTLFYNPRFPYGRRYEVRGSAMAIQKDSSPEYSYTGLNLPMERIEQLIMNSIDAGQSLYFEADVMNSADFSPADPTKPNSGILHPKLYNNDPVYGFSGLRSLYPSRAFLDFYRLISATHAMSIRGYDRPDPKAPPIKYLVENSWGDKVGDKGMLHMYREWLHQNVFGIVVRRSLLSKKERDALERKPRLVSTDEW